MQTYIIIMCIRYYIFFVFDLVAAFRSNYCKLSEGPKRLRQYTDSQKSELSNKLLQKVLSEMASCHGRWYTKLNLL